MFIHIFIPNFKHKFANSYLLLAHSLKQQVVITPNEEFFSSTETNRASYKVQFAPSRSFAFSGLRVHT